VDRYVLSVVLPDQRRFTIGEISIGHEYQGEYFDNILANRNSDYSQLPGWLSYQQPIYLRQKAAIWGKGESLQAYRPIQILSPGEYSLMVKVYDYGNGSVNKIEIQLGSQSYEFAWHSSEVGVRWLEMPITLASQTNELTYKVLEKGQGFIILDAIAIYPKARTD
jgi:hypothetical protein